MTRDRADGASTRSGMFDVGARAARAGGRGRRPLEQRHRRAARRATTSSNVVVLGMGGSGIAGDVLAAVAGAVRARCRSSVSKGYELPGFVGPRTLVLRRLVLGRHRGDGRGGAPRRPRAGARVVVVCQGGELGRAGGGRGARRCIAVPGRHPDAARAPSARWRVPPLVVLERRRAVPGRTRVGRSDAVDAARGAGATSWSRPRQRRRRRWPGGSAARCRSSTAAAASARVAAMRWKTQVNENAKAPAVLPTGCPSCATTRSAGWGQHGDVTRQVLTLVQLRHDDEHPQVARRFELVERRWTTRWWPAIARGAGRGRRAARPAASTSCSSGDVMSLAPGRPGRRRPGPDPVLDASRHSHRSERRSPLALS